MKQIRRLLILVAVVVGGCGAEPGQSSPSDDEAYNELRVLWNLEEPAERDSRAAALVDQYEDPSELLFFAYEEIATARSGPLILSHIKLDQSDTERVQQRLSNIEIGQQGKMFMLQLVIDAGAHLGDVSSSIDKSLRDREERGSLLDPISPSYALALRAQWPRSKDAVMKLLDERGLSLRRVAVDVLSGLEVDSATLTEVLNRLNATTRVDIQCDLVRSLALLSEEGLQRAKPTLEKLAERATDVYLKEYLADLLKRADKD